MNIYKKLAGARVLLQKSPIKKSGKNQHLKFDYMELDDFLPTVNAINEQIGLTSVFSLTDTTATLRIYDHDSEGMIEFTSPVAHAKLQGNASPIQELGSQHTYMRRYMYLLAYEICEHDVLDGQIGQPQQESPKSQPKQAPKPQPKPEPQVMHLTPDQLSTIIDLADSKGVAHSSVAQAYKKTAIDYLTVEDYGNAILKLSTKADKQ